ncbi:hypothetical protein B0H16DRAFT_1449580 [Mycena metata]|uniref:Uncharacterized protein n=1 Tax=Mycena metata TaxID=1033252 RepID=A0AAD7NUX9_9AGAR|nr:hypothetical protein B0H16DRAFT_1449580 [Mycena metata]
MIEAKGIDQDTSKHYGYSPGIYPADDAGIEIRLELGWMGIRRGMGIDGIADDYGEQHGGWLAAGMLGGSGGEGGHRYGSKVFARRFVLGKTRKTVRMPPHVPHGKIGTATASQQPGYNTGAQRTRPFSTGNGNGLRSGQAKPQILNGGQSQDQLRSHTVRIAHLATSDAGYPPHCNASQTDEIYKLEDWTKTVEDLETRRESRMVRRGPEWAFE